MYKYIYIFVGMAGVMARLPRVWGEADLISPICNYIPHTSNPSFYVYPFGPRSAFYRSYIGMHTFNYIPSPHLYLSALELYAFGSVTPISCLVCVFVM